MKLKTFIIGFVIVMAMINMVSVAKAEHMDEFPTMECDSPTETHAVQVVNDGTLKFNVTKVEVSKNACIRMIFWNPTEVEHDFTVADKEGVEWIHMDSINAAEDELGTNTTNDAANGELQGQGYATHFYMTPNEDITLNFHCEVPGHNTTMTGDFIIGAGSPGSASSPGFEATSVVIGFLSIAAIVTIYKKKN
jgi:uncharacterized cupredoxin-like copper-binding protein